MNKKNLPPPLLNKMSEQIGLFIQYWGFKKIHGQIWTHIYLSPHPISAHEIGSRLKVSKALISLSMKDLIHYDLIQQVKSENKKTKLFIANPNVFEVILNVLRQREVKMIQNIEKVYETLEEHNKKNPLAEIDPEKMENLGQMISVANLLLQNLIDLKTVNVSPLFDIEK